MGGNQRVEASEAAEVGGHATAVAERRIEHTVGAVAREREVGLRFRFGGSEDHEARTLTNERRGGVVAREGGREDAAPAERGVEAAVTLESREAERRSGSAVRRARDDDPPVRQAEEVVVQGHVEMGVGDAGLAEPTVEPSGRVEAQHGEAATAAGIDRACDQQPVVGVDPQPHALDAGDRRVEPGDAVGPEPRIDRTVGVPARERQRAPHRRRRDDAPMRRRGQRRRVHEEVRFVDGVVTIPACPKLGSTTPRASKRASAKASPRSACARPPTTNPPCASGSKSRVLFQVPPKSVTVVPSTPNPGSRLPSARKRASMTSVLLEMTRPPLGDHHERAVGLWGDRQGFALLVARKGHQHAPAVAEGRIERAVGLVAGEGDREAEVGKDCLARGDELAVGLEREGAGLVAGLVLGLLWVVCRRSRVRIEHAVGGHAPERRSRGTLHADDGEPLVGEARGRGDDRAVPASIGRLPASAKLGSSAPVAVNCASIVMPTHASSSMNPPPAPGPTASTRSGRSHSSWTAVPGCDAEGRVDRSIQA